MSVQIKTLDDYGFLLSFIGGIITAVMAILLLIITIAGERIHWFWGGGYIGIANPIAGAITSMIFASLAIVIGLKLFSQKIREILIKIDLVITSIVLIVLGIIALGIGSIIILIGGIIILVYRLMPQGQANPTGK